MEYLFLAQLDSDEQERAVEVWHVFREGRQWLAVVARRHPGGEAGVFEVQPLNNLRPIRLP